MVMVSDSDDDGGEDCDNNDNIHEEIPNSLIVAWDTENENTTPNDKAIRPSEKTQKIQCPNSLLQ